MVIYANEVETNENINYLRQKINYNIYTHLKSSTAQKGRIVSFSCLLTMRLRLKPSSCYKISPILAKANTE